MPREGAIIFRDLVGKLEVLNVECDKCGRRGRYHLHRLIERYGIEAKLFDWSDEITADCPRRCVRRAVPRSTQSPLNTRLVSHSTPTHRARDGVIESAAALAARRRR